VLNSRWIMADAANTLRSICVIVPAYNAAHLLARVLKPLLAMHKTGEIQELILVDDCSTDDTADVAREIGARVITTPRNSGPGFARNFAAKHTDKSILWLVDSDVIAMPGGGEKIRAAFNEPEVKAVFGSYDDAPDGAYWFSRYKNLTHRFYHQTAQRGASTFWAGCGALDAKMFNDVGGFDVETYRVPSIEDIELGYRIRRAGGRIVLDPTLVGKHLKIWTLRSAVYSDIFRRALPWSRLMLADGEIVNDLNTSFSERLRAVVAGLLLLSVVTLPAVPDVWPVTVVLAGLALILNWKLARFLFSNGGVLFTVGSLLFHQIYYTYSSAAFAWCWLEYRIAGRSHRLKSSQAK